ncbi:TPA: DNA-binding protein [Pseudomonas aeruginosa]|uniref:Phage transcriptional regulator, AlpA n=2 Tax=Pseudomonas aeruginosa group TaxID=136841 RepID=A0A2R3J5D4_9PSED|nr:MULTISPECIES: hypothetical protein [Pseudomonadaceae]ASA32833.1 DNA-binding protein [Pseudomonas aeruginosa]UXA38111.1 DNA-binding protein [Pseudomonas juntendi]ASD07258.1 DNA-binding protein [Pseudomonas aeruginosa]AVK09355.1 putative phage transcriptional regulator, AlpA [Pseudomonas paraeruginosa]AWE95822.1 putative phage transcriptional regulator, AlpA [Pseudomonas paraeruginosa]
MAPLEIRHRSVRPISAKHAQASRFLQQSPLEKHRTYGTGPTYRKVGGRVLYTVRDLEDWSAVGERKSTRDKTAGTVFPARPLTPEERDEC